MTDIVVPEYQGISRKWPTMLVMGNNVTKDQAKEIIIRTSGLQFTSNDKEYCKQLYEAAGVGSNDRGWPKWEQWEQKKAEYGVLDLNYITNSRIVSCHIDGPIGS